MRDDDLAEVFQVKVLDLLKERCSLARRGSEFDLRSGDAGGIFVSLLLMPGYGTVGFGVVGVRSWLSHFHDRSGCPPIPWTSTMLLRGGQ
jgi:hypothetical protein